MYIIKNAFKNVIRNKGKSILIGVIVTVIMLSSCIALAIHRSAELLIDSYRDNNPIQVTLEQSMGRGNRDQKSDGENESVPTIKQLTIQEIESYQDSDLVTGSYYTLETSVSSDDIEPITYEESTENENRPEMPEENGRRNMEMGDFRLTGYSDPAYIAELESGTKKIKEGELFTKDSDDYVAVISEELAEANDLSVGDEFSIYSPESSDTFLLKVVAIYEDNSDVESDNFMNMNAMNSRNQIYTNIATASAINENVEENGGMGRGVSATFYLKNSNDVNSFETELRKKGLDDAFSLRTNEEEALASLKPIQNLSNFSYTFLFVIFIVGGIVLVTICIIQIRDRKYEIGVLRAIGMSKWKVTLQLLCELVIIAIVAFILGTTTGIFASQPVTNHMLASEIKSMEEETTARQENFGPGSFERPEKPGNGMMSFNNKDFVSQLTVTVDFPMIIILTGVSFILIMITGGVASMYINKYEPNKILQNRN